jgi:hypothetical protein
MSADGDVMAVLVPSSSFHVETIIETLLAVLRCKYEQGDNVTGSYSKHPLLVPSFSE